MATRDLSPGAPTLDDHVVRLGDLSGYAQNDENLSGLTSASTARTNLGLVIGSHVQAYSSVLAGTTNSFTTTKNTKLTGIATGATANATDAALRARSSHTGTQLLATVSDAGSIASKDFWSGTQAAYDALTPDADTIYFIEA